MARLVFARDSWFLTGPTASGKTLAGIELALELGAEIVSLDSMAIYRGLDIGTAKPTADERRVVPHHLIDAVDPDEEFSLARYLAAAEAASNRILASGRQVLFVGGTPLYLKGLLRGIFRGPPADWALRRHFEVEARLHGPGWLHERLAEVDPQSAGRLHPNDTRRLIRALEVCEKIGQPISRLQRQFHAGRSAGQCRVFVLDWPRAELYARIDARVETMFARGFVDEVRALLARPRPLGRTARQAVGYREVIEHLAGQRDLVQTIEQVKTRTRQFARRQLTWFRSLTECRWIPLSAGDRPADIARRIAGAKPFSIAKGRGGRRR